MISPVKDTFEFYGASFLLDIIPPASSVNSLLLYSGNVEFMLGAANRSVIANTNKYVIYEFWRCMLDDPGRVASIANFLDKSIMGSTNDIAIAAQERWAEYKDPYVRAALFFLLNRYSENGQVSSGGIDTARLNPIVLHRLKSFKAKNFYLNFNKQKIIYNNKKIIFNGTKFIKKIPLEDKIRKNINIISKKLPGLNSFFGIIS